MEGRKVVDKWLRETEWGQLFLTYGDPFADAPQKASGVSGSKARA